MKKLLHIIALTSAALTVTAEATAADFVTDGLRFTTTSDSTVSVKNYLEGSKIAIPDSITITEPATEEGAEPTKRVYAVTAVGARAFYEADVESVTVPSTVGTIDRYAFWKSTVKSVTIADGTVTIGYGAFKACPRLSEVRLPATLKELGSVYEMLGVGGAVFTECTALEKIEIPASISRLPELTFMGCTSLSEVTLNEGLEEIGERVFEGCTNLTEIELPRTVTTVERAAFNGSWLDHPVFPGTVAILPNSCYLWCGNMKGFTIEEGVVEIGRQSFADCGAITEINVPNSVEWIRSDAFQGNAMVETIHLGSGLRRLGHSSLAVWAPDQATNTPHWALKDIYIAAPVPPYHEQNDDHFDTLDDDFFFGGKEFTDELREKFYSEVTLHVTDEALVSFREDAIWGKFANIVGGYSAIGDIHADKSPAITIEGRTATSLTDGIEVYGVAGALVKKTAGNSISLDGLAPGIYVLRSGTAVAKAAVR